MMSLDALAKELREAYGDFMKSSEVAGRLKVHKNTVGKIPEKQLPRRRRAGRGGCLFLTDNVAKYIVDYHYPSVTSTDHRLVQAVISGSPTPVGQGTSSGIRSVGVDTGKLLLQLSRAYKSTPFEGDLALHNLGVDADVGEAMLAALVQNNLLTVDVLGFYTIPHDTRKELAAREGGQS